MKPAQWQWLKQLPSLLAIPATAAADRLRRIQVLERNIGLPVKLVVWALLYYFLFRSDWFTGVSEVGDLTLNTAHQFFLVYLVINLGVAAVLFLMHQLPSGIVRWVLFFANLLDGLFLAAVTLVTGGLESIAYWAFLALILRNAFSFPGPGLQLSLNVLLITAYLLATVVGKSVTEFEQATAAVELATGGTNVVARARMPIPLTNAPPTKRSSLARTTRVPTGESAAEPDREVSTQFLLMRISLLLLMTVCGYGVQVMLYRQRRAEEEGREFVLRQEQLRSAGRLAAEFAHQIKNPLAIINNAAFSLRHALATGKDNATQQIAIIQEEVARSDQIVTQIMGYAQLSEGRVEKLDVIEELDRAIDQVFPPAADYGVHLERHYTGPFPPLLMHRPHLSEIFINVLQNAREALAGTGNIAVTARCLSDYSVAVTIQDDGPGIPADKSERIFEAYYTTKERGTGLGLAIVKHNVDLYGGSVRVESELGKGARFTLQFPAKTLIQLTQ